MTQSRSPKIKFNQEVVFRVLTIISFGYPLTMLVGIVISYLLPLSKPDAVAAASMLSFSLYTAFIMWAFAQKSWQQVLRVSTLLLVAFALLKALLTWSVEVL